MIAQQDQIRRSALAQKDLTTAKPLHEEPSVSIRRPAFGDHVLGNFLGQGLPLRQPPTERLDKSFIALPTLGLGGGLRRIRQWWRGREPEANEQCQCSRSRW